MDVHRRVGNGSKSVWSFEKMYYLIVMLFDDGALTDQDTVYQLHDACITTISLRSIHITQEKFCKYLHRKGSDVCEAFHED